MDVNIDGFDYLGKLASDSLVEVSCVFCLFLVGGHVVDCRWIRDE